MRNKFILNEELIKPKLDIFLVSETKTDDSFPNQHSFPNQQFSKMDIKYIVEIQTNLMEISNFTLMKIYLAEN